MTRDEIVTRIQSRAEAVKSFGATALFMFGSRVRGEERAASDLDIFIDFDPARFSFVELVGLEEMLSRELGLSVQLGTRDGLHPLLRSRIERDAIRVL